MATEQIPRMVESLDVHRRKKAEKSEAEHPVETPAETPVMEMTAPEQQPISSASIKRRRVAILGTVPHKLMAPFADPEFEIWAIAHACLGDPLPRVDRIFEIHKWDEVVKWGSPQSWAMFPAAPVYLQEARPDVPNSIRFPFEELADKFRIFDDRPEVSFTNSISLMVALAIDEGFDEIHIYGVNMSHHTEYGTQKPSCEYYLGLAKGLGKKIFVPPVSDLLKSNFIYGRDEEAQTELVKKVEERMNWLMSCYNQTAGQNKQLNDSMQQHIGAIEDCKFWLQFFKQ